MRMIKSPGAASISISTDTIIRAFLLILGAYIIWILSDLVLILLTSIVIASFVESSVPHFKKIGIGRILGVVISYAGSLFLLAGLFYLFAPLLVTELYNFSNSISSYFPGVS